MDKQAIRYRNLASKRKKRVAEFFVCDDRHDAKADIGTFLFFLL